MITPERTQADSNGTTRSSGRSRASSTSTRGLAGRPRNPARVALAVLLVLGGALVSVQLYRSAGERSSVIAVARDVPAGAVISVDDLTAVEMNADRVATIPASQSGSVIGRVARVALARGSVLTSGQVADTLQLPPAEGIVSVPVLSGLVPPGLRAESPVRLLLFAGDADTGQAASTVDGIVVSVGADSDTSPNRVVAVRIPADRALDVSRAAAASKLALMVIG